MCFERNSLTWLFESLLDGIPSHSDAFELKKRKDKEGPRAEVGNKLRHAVVLAERGFEIITCQKRMPEFLDENAQHRHHSNATVFEFRLAQLFLLANGFASVKVQGIEEPEWSRAGE